MDLQSSAWDFKLGNTSANIAWTSASLFLFPVTKVTTILFIYIKKNAGDFIFCMMSWRWWNTVSDVIREKEKKTESNNNKKRN